jgi:hypothetical protein
MHSLREASRKTTFSVRFSPRHLGQRVSIDAGGEIGRPFQDRYKALPVELGEALAEVDHHVHLIAVRAKIESADRLKKAKGGKL